MESDTTFAPEPTGIDGNGPARSIIRRTLTDSLYAITAFPVSLLGFSLALPLLALGVSLAVLGVGLPVLAGAVIAARALAELERSRLRSLLSSEASVAAYRSEPSTAGWWRSTLAPLRDPQSWRDVAWSLTGILTATLAFVVVITWWAAALAGLTYWVWQGFLPDDSDTITLASVLGLSDNRFIQSILNLAIGAAAAASLPLVAHLAASVHASTAAALLTATSDRADD